jgi:hypothetical protein
MRENRLFQTPKRFILSAQLTVWLRQTIDLFSDVRGTFHEKIKYRQKNILSPVDCALLCVSLRHKTRPKLAACAAKRIFDLRRGVMLVGQHVFQKHSQRPPAVAAAKPANLRPNFLSSSSKVTAADAMPVKTASANRTTGWSRKTRLLVYGLSADVIELFHVIVCRPPLLRQEMERGTLLSPG